MLSGENLLVLVVCQSVSVSKCYKFLHPLHSIYMYLYNHALYFRSRLAQLNEKLTTLERKIEYLEARVSGEDLNRTQPAEA